MQVPAARLLFDRLKDAGEGAAVRQSGAMEGQSVAKLPHDKSPFLRLI